MYWPHLQVAAIGHRSAGLDPELVALVYLAIVDTLHLQRMQTCKANKQQVEGIRLSARGELRCTVGEVTVKSLSRSCGLPAMYNRITTRTQGEAIFYE